MTLQKALESSKRNDFIYRRKWLENGSKIKILTSVKAVDRLHINLTQESFFADDWEITEE